MIYILFITTIIKVVAAAGNLESPIAGYTAVPMTFHAVNMTSMTKVLLRGTVQVRTPSSSAFLEITVTLPLTLAIQEIQDQLEGNDDIEVDHSPLIPQVDQPPSLTSRNVRIGAPTLPHASPFSFLF